MSAKADNPTVLATRDQRRAADPAVSAWVSASAGSGKTQVLRDRVLRLLLEGAAPERILCLTFTKAGAAEMSNRIATTLAEWASMPEVALKADLKKLAGDMGLARLIPVARGLFAKVLDAPGGMRIDTIHAFCQSLLRRFPLEARVMPHFRLIEERDSATLLLQAREEQLNAARAGAGNLGAALAHLVQRSGEIGIGSVIGELLRDRARLVALQRQMSDIEAYRRALAGLLGVSADANRADIVAAAFADAAFDSVALRAAMAALAQGAKTDNARAAILDAFLAADVDQRAAMLDEYLSVFLTAKNEIRATLASKGAIAAMPDVAHILEREAERLLRLLDKLRAVDILADSTALMTLGLDLLARFRKLKEAHAALDFDDLILATRDLLLRPGIAPWVLYKLDGGIDHVLIDEGQDTSPTQWDIIKALTEELIAGSGRDRSYAVSGKVAEKPRSIFAVGDFKQSIFSFQGAEPRAFLAAREHFRSQLARDRGAADTRTPFLDLPLNVSFRSSPAILRAVDAVFAGTTGSGVAEADRKIQHVPARSGAAGLVEVWPLAVPLDVTPPLPWMPPAIDTDPGDPGTRVANAIADKIADLIRGNASLEARGRPVTAGDIMVLVRSRNAFVPTLVKALKARQVEVSGIDRLALLSELAVMDLVALIDFILLPEDNLNLAALLKSPLVGLTEAELFDLCIARGDGTLWQELNRAAANAERIAAARDFLQTYLDRALILTPYEFLADLLSAGGGRKKLFARLGLQVGEAVDELLNLALGYEANNLSSLQGFRHWLEMGEAVVKRELTEDGGGQVRIMTVHGAKGLQAPIVFVVDARRRKPNRPGLFWLGEEYAALPVWVQRKEMDVAPTASARAEIEQRSQEEENRLLYVALTRAEDRLYICGWRGRVSATSASWHDNVTEAMAGLENVVVQPAEQWRAEAGWEGASYTHSNAQSDAPGDKVAKAGLAIDLTTPLLPWSLLPVDPEPDPPRPLIPSRPSTEGGAPLEAPLLSPLGQDQGFRFQRGLVIHKLFQLLPDLPLASRREAARHWLDSINRPSGLMAEDSALDAIVAEVMAVLEAPEFAHLFVPGSRAEVPIVAELSRADGGRQILSGQIDRLLVTPTECHIIDFKSNRPPAMRAEHVSKQYLRQLALYRSAMRGIYPDRTVSCYLLWSAVPSLMAIPDSLLESYAS
ncbi:double-strand break repair helicase AddA [Dongia sp.]|uniref:double-strand break repair helicase AddA n=1 Tax=Dongia sp. TaxID=1977262 RepID=UPI0035ADC7D2